MWGRWLELLVVIIYQCLVRLRHETDTLVIWIDAICINQQSNQEKNTQVPLIKDIYLAAEKVYIWLGDVTDGLNVVMSSIQIVSDGDLQSKFEKLEDIAVGLNASPEEIVSGK